MNEQLCQIWRRCAPPFFCYLRKTDGGGTYVPPGRARVKLPAARLETGKRRFCYRGAALYNLLPTDITDLPPKRFKRALNLRPAGGVFEHPPCGFSRIARKRRRAAPPGFHLPYSPFFWQLLWKFRSWVMQGQVTRSGQVTIPYKNFTIAPQLVFEGKLWNFRNMIRSSVPTKCISWIFDIGDLRSGHFRDLPIISQWQKLNSLFYASSWAYMNGIALGKVFIDTPSAIFSRWPL